MKFIFNRVFIIEKIHFDFQTADHNDLIALELKKRERKT